MADNPKDSLKVGSEGDKNFDLHSDSYAGPENMVPDNKGVKNPDDISKKEVSLECKV